MLYCTVCDYNNGDCEIHNTMDAWGLQHQTYEYKEKPYEKNYGPFYRYDPNQCILCGRCVEACQDIEVNETIRIDRIVNIHVLFGIMMYRLMIVFMCILWSMCDGMSM